VPVDFEVSNSWWERLKLAGFNPDLPAVVASAGVSMYLTKDAIAATLRQAATLAPSSIFAMTFLLRLTLADREARPGLQFAEKGARAQGTPFISFFTPAEMLTLARKAGFREVQHVSAAALAQRYFAAGRMAFACLTIQRNCWWRLRSSPVIEAEACGQSGASRGCSTGLLSAPLDDRVPRMLSRARRIIGRTGKWTFHDRIVANRSSPINRHQPREVRLVGRCFLSFDTLHPAACKLTVTLTRVREARERSFAVSRFHGLA
jgi:leucine carboxyl methyltransferase